MAIERTPVQYLGTQDGPIVSLPTTQHNGRQQRRTGRSTQGVEPAQLPTNIDAERAVLGSLLIDPDALGMVDTVLRVEHFNLAEHQAIYAAILSLAARGEPIDELTIRSELLRNGSVDENVITTIYGLSHHVPTSWNIAAYAREVEAAATNRKVISYSANLAALAYQAGSADETLARARELLEAIETAHAAALASGAEDETFTLRDLLATDFPEPRWIVPGFIPEGLSLMPGDPKIGKSWLVYGIALAVGAGGVAFGKTPVERGEVLYLALEDHERRLKNRALKMLETDEAPDGIRLATSWPRLDEGGATKLTNYLEKHPGTRLVIIDTLAKIRPKQSPDGSVYSEDYAALEGLKKIADERHIAIVVIHHVSKRNSDDPLSNVSGSTGLTGGVDNVLVLSRKRNTDDATLFVTGRDVDEEEYAFRFDRTRCLWTLEGSAEEVGKSREREAVLTILREAEEPLKIGEIAERLDKRYDYAKCILSRMTASGEVLKVDRGRYAPALVTNDVAQRARTDTADTTDTLIPDTFSSASSASSQRPDEHRHSRSDLVSKYQSISSIAGISTDTANPNAASAASRMSFLDLEGCRIERHEDYWYFSADGAPRCKLCHPPVERRPQQS